MNKARYQIQKYAGLATLAATLLLRVRPVFEATAVRLPI
jgi:hypothetical protein